MNQERLRSFVEQMRERVVGQPLAIAKIEDTLNSAATSPKTARPLAAFLFLGGAGLGKRTTAQAIADVLFDGEDTYKNITASASIESDVVKALSERPRVALFRYVSGVSSEPERASLAALLKQFKENAPRLNKAGHPPNLGKSIFILAINADLPPDLFSSESKEADESLQLWLQKHFREFSSDFFESFDAIIPFKRFNVAAKTRLAEMMIARCVKQQAAEGRTLSVDNSVTAYVGSRAKDDLGALDVQSALDQYVNTPFNEAATKQADTGTSPKTVRIHVVGDAIRISIE